jgi:hypothetical protein
MAWLVENSTALAGWSPTRARFALTKHGDATVAAAESIFEPNNLLVRAMLPMIRRKFHEIQRTILASLKESLERDGDAAVLRSEDGSAFDTSSRTRPAVAVHSAKARGVFAERQKP